MNLTSRQQTHLNHVFTTTTTSPSTTLISMVSSSHPSTPAFSQVLSQPTRSYQVMSRASTPSLSVELPHQLEDGPTSTELSEHGIDAVHNFLATNCTNYETICTRFPRETRAMEIAWIVTGTQNDGQHQYPHVSFIQNLKSKSWKVLRADLKSLMFDAVSSLNSHMLQPVLMLAIIGMCSQ